MTSSRSSAAAPIADHEQIYREMLTDPGRCWTVCGLAMQLPNSSHNNLRTALLLLVGERLADLTNGGSVLGVQLTADGAAALDAFVERGSTEPTESLLPQFTR